MALAENISAREDQSDDRQEADVVLGDDFIAPDSTVEKELRDSRARRSLFSLNRSPLTRKIITFNLIALNVLVAGILWLNSSRDTLVLQRGNAVSAEAELVADALEARLPAAGAPVSLGTSDEIDLAGALEGLDLRQGVEVLVFDAGNFLVGETRGTLPPLQRVDARDTDRPTLISDFLDSIWLGAAGIFAYFEDTPQLALEDRLRRLIEGSDPTLTRVQSGTGADGETLFTALTPIRQGDAIVGTVAMVSTEAEIDAAVSAERERVLQMFVIATLVSIGLSLVLASTIANPISDLADAAEIGRDRNSRTKGTSRRIRIPDLTARPDEIGRLSGALRGMVAALYDRIDSNEQFAADVAHEIKNPLASLRSAIGSLRIVKKEEHRDKLLDVIEHDVRRLDRLVSDISNASRLDAELVKEEEQEFDLLEMLGNLTQFLGEDARRKGVEFITDLPGSEITINGLEPRLAQVFVNLITNAISFCEDGDAIRVWARRRDNRVLVVVEDTGPGIPEEALQKIFKRFYSQRPENDFGNNSGLGLAISKQIVEAHGGVIWAENIRPTEADVTSEPLGARFVVGLPV
ncbi:MAG: histidine kinase [Rhodobacteraceae bacterium]|jgi:two-component system sensor histidine kinase ChvG|uniref:histidine kinase n=1 Tax=Salipiger profundus TaxID=1229727 RepID=A0A1U7D5J7_9RHOB|nr:MULTISPECIES: sensor histidine kinase [Salipiger]APX23444.1 two-component system, OmpR family, sensor histidine kinase ChvG [Salipiger profundus]MAB07934.1 histidine kinase [Paracoccaceae bacterium]GGA20299.1 sensor histidine kinase [Salipiger profundus]SFC88642.1 two-component system, OmpR family, sensor histidine kinase ChvG [Salipiger profundus]